MDAKPHLRFVIPDRTFVSMAKRDVTRLAEGHGFSPVEVGKINIIVAEMLSNLVKHVPAGGELLVKPLGHPVRGLEILCFDNGPGIRDLSRMLQDGVSTSGTAGEGLGAIQRQSSEFDIFSQLGVGTVVLSRLFKAPRHSAAPPSPAPFEVGCVMLPKPNENACGDGYTQIPLDQGLLLLVLDGLGHGPLAQEAAQEGIAALHAKPQTEPVAALRHIHETIRRTRGAVGFVAYINSKAAQISFCGVGNISGKLYTAESGRILPSYKNIISYNGILGHNIPNSLHGQTMDWAHNNLLILHSDGLKTRWDLSKYPLLHRHHASIIATVLYKEHTRQTDDALILVCKGRNQ